MNNKIPPLIVGLVTGLLMLFIANQLQWGHYYLAQKLWVFFLLGAIGAGMALAGVVTFNLANTTANPMSPNKASSLVSHGIYSVTRNPMYLGVLIVLSGWSAYLGSLLSIVVLPGYVWYITRFQIIPEEIALERIFGQSFTEYQNNVRRWI